MPPPPRTAGGRRLYASSDLKTLIFIRKARELGFSLEDTRALLALRGPDNECADVKAIALKRLDMVRAQKSHILEVERILSDAVARCPGGPTANCSLLALPDSSSPTPQLADRSHGFQRSQARFLCRYATNLLRKSNNAIELR
jgi:MerR family mercuric resistance operon transcriptional regulator